MRTFPQSLRIFLLVLLILPLCGRTLAGSGRSYEAPRAQTAPTIDGNGNDACWAGASWYYVDQTWLGTTPTASDFSGRFKLTWDANKLYVLGEITNDVLNDYYPNPLDNYWNDDTFEILLDENNSGGDHQFNYNAFAYHVSTLMDAVDIDIDQQAKLFNDHIKVKWTKNGNVYTWECAVTVYTDAFVYGATNNPLATLAVNKKMGFALAYCDNDGASTRDNFMGSEVVSGTDKNVAYKDAGIFGVVTLVDVPTNAVTFTQVPVVTGLANPTVMVCAADGRIFVCEQEGNLRVIKNGSLLTTPVVTVSTTLIGSYSERGLIGMAIDPNFATNNYIYLYYTTTQGSTHNRVSRFTLNGDVAVAGSEVILLELDPLGSSVSHNGGAMAFGKDGMLYIATGDNQLTDVPRVSQDLTKTHGKLLRINPDGTAPMDNPFMNGTGRSNLVWNYGFRNPFTFDVQPGTGKIFVNDVGQDTWEEINDATTGGKNFGWPNAEGMSSDPTYTNPLYTYTHTPASDSTGCAITGGTFFNPVSTNYPSSYIGKYFFMDYCNNWINYVDPANGFKRKTFLSNVSGAPIGIDVGIDGNLYYLSRGNSAVYKIVCSASPLPVILDQPDSLSVFASQPATFKVIVSGTGPFTYQWRKNGADIAGATSATYTIPSTAAADAGNYTVYITNAFGNATSTIATLTVGPYNAPPVATITSPVNGTLYSGGETFTFSGTATDPEDGTLPLSSYTWFIDLHHNTHVHNGVPITNVASGTYTIPTSGETSDNVWFRFTLVVKDSKGSTDTTYVEIFPRKSTLSFATIPAGLKVKLDGQPVSTPSSVLSVQGVKRSIDPFTPQFLNGVAYEFDYWQQGGDAHQVFPTPATNTTYTAVYKKMILDTTLIPVIQDAYVQDGAQTASDATTAFGSTNPAQLVSKIYAQGPNRNVYLMFDVSGFQDSIVGATLKLYGSIEATTTNPASSIPVALYTSSVTTWNENTITWNNKPAVSASALDTTVITGNTGSYFYWDVTSYIRSERAAGRAKSTLVLINTQSLYPRVYFNSKESPDGKGPSLIITSGEKTPVVNITAPAANATYNAPASITITVTASDADGTVSRVDFYNGSTLLGTSTTAPYSYIWQNVAAGTYNIKAIATDNQGGTGSSPSVTVKVLPPNQSPSISITSPASNAPFSAPANIAFTVNASDPDGTVSKVDYYNGTTFIGTSTSDPFSFTWQNVTAGSYSITAKATDNQGATTTSAPISIQVTPQNTPPAVSISAPANNTKFIAPAGITITANASDADGTVNRVDFYNGTALIGTSTVAPFSFTWPNVAPGNYTLTAKATDNQGATTTSASVTIQVAQNQAPAVSISAPANNSSFPELSNITITANASDPDGSVSKVDFYNGSSLLGTSTTAPYSFTLLNAAAGTYTISAKVTDNLGATTTSSVISIIVVRQNDPPSVSITAPADNASFTGNASVTITATASDPSGAVSKVELYNGTALLATLTTAPYSYTWANIPPGDYTILAIATNSLGVTASSSVHIHVIQQSIPPEVTITNPQNNAVYPANASITIQATATDNDGSVSSVQFYNGSSLMGIVYTPPYNYTWNNIPAGTYSIRVVATDNGNNTSEVQTVVITIEEASAVIQPGTGTRSALVYPNPSNGLFRIKVSEETETLRILNIYGEEKVVMHHIPAGSEIEIGESLESGTHLLQLQYLSKDSEMLRLVKVK